MEEDLFLSDGDEYDEMEPIQIEADWRTLESNSSGGTFGDVGAGVGAGAGAGAGASASASGGEAAVGQSQANAGKWKKHISTQPQRPPTLTDFDLPHLVLLREYPMPWRAFVQVTEGIGVKEVDGEDRATTTTDTATTLGLSLADAAAAADAAADVASAYTEEVIRGQVLSQLYSHYSSITCTAPHPTLSSGLLATDGA